MADATLTIGQVAARAGVNVSAIRYYERNGLMPEPERVSGQRRYTDQAIQRLGIIDAAKQAGFNLGEVKVLLDSADDGHRAHELFGTRPASKGERRLWRQIRPRNATSSSRHTSSRWDAPWS